MVGNQNQGLAVPTLQLFLVYLLYNLVEEFLCQQSVSADPSLIDLGKACYNVCVWISGLHRYITIA